MALRHLQPQSSFNKHLSIMIKSAIFAHCRVRLCHTNTNKSTTRSKHISLTFLFIFFHFQEPSRLHGPEFDCCSWGHPRNEPSIQALHCLLSSETCFPMF